MSTPESTAADPSPAVADVFTETPPTGLDRVGLVAIGRNEGDRLHRCLTSAKAQLGRIVYVDSGSFDGSEELARSLDVPVVNLDMSIPFTAARARNAGFERLMALHPGVEYVQFVDGDCELDAGWLQRGMAELDADPGLAVVAGRRRERHPEETIYNRLCDLEWDTPVGPAKACGGDALFRVPAFLESGGFDSSVLAGEEPELCVRLRKRDWRILRADAEMTLHDAQMSRFAQWWKRNVRAGYAYALGAFLHGASPERHWVRECRSIWFWAFWLPLAAIALALPTRGASMLLLIGYPVLAWRIARHCRRRGLSSGETRLFTVFTILGKFPQLIGQMLFRADRWSHRRRGVMDHRQ
jgi:GT2 family glycosyltransferase